MKIGEELRRAREASGLSQEQLATKARISRVYVSMLEHDKKSPTLDVFCRICRAMNVSASTLIGRIEKSS